MKSLNADRFSIFLGPDVDCRLVLGHRTGRPWQEPIREGPREDPMEDQDLHPAHTNMTGVPCQFVIPHPKGQWTLQDLMRFEHPARLGGATATAANPPLIFYKLANVIWTLLRSFLVPSSSFVIFILSALVA